MNKRSIACGIVACLGMVCLVVLGCGHWLSPSASLSQGVLPGEQARFVSIPDVFGKLERPPVRFDHDKHTLALGPESCKECHRTDDKGNFRFTYSIVENQTDKNALMNVFHDDCIGCHTRRLREGETAGPVTCGECHVVEREYAGHEYVPVMPDYYEVLRDTYHSDCTACHQEPSKLIKDAKPLDWKSFYVKQRKTEAQWPKVTFDYLVHEKHVAVLGDQCGLCHFIPPEKLEKLKAEGKKPDNLDWARDVDRTNRLVERPTAHAHCINCHLQLKAQAKPGGPIHCGECHSGARRTIEALADVGRPDCGQDDMMLIQLDKGAEAKAVAFNHRAHVAKSRSCQDCHHKTLRPCGECHTVDGCKEGGWVTLAEAHHEVSSSRSCVGCHEAQKHKPDCAGCHRFMPGGLVHSRCAGCHTGSLDPLRTPKKLPPPEDLIPGDVNDEIAISRIEAAYGPARLPHLSKARKLTEISNHSALASYFHADPMTVCVGCHHLAPLEPKADVPRCVTCHTARDEPVSKTPTLLGAYHQRCLGCHQRMDPTGQVMPQTCTGCHEEKIPGKKHPTVLRQE